MSDPLYSIHHLTQTGPVKGAKPLSPQECSKSLKAKDTLAISDKAIEKQKIQSWVKELINMPDLRAQSIATAKDLETVTPQKLKAIAQKLAEGL